MPRYLIQAKSNRRETLACPDELGTWVQDVVERLGGRLDSLDYTIGEEDLVLLVEMPDEASMAGFSELASSADKLQVSRVAPLIKPEEARVALSRTGHSVDLPQPRPLAAAPVAPEPPAQDDGFVTAAYGSQLGNGRGPLPSAPEELPVPVDSPPEDVVLPSMVAQLGDVPPGAFGLLAGRFTRFSELGAFSETLQALPGIQAVTIQQFLRGMVSMRIQYESPIPLKTRLMELRQFKPEVREIGPAQYEMLIFAETRGGPRVGATESSSAVSPVLNQPAATAEAAEETEPPAEAEPQAAAVTAPSPAPAHPQPLVQPLQHPEGLLHSAMVREARGQTEPAPPRTRGRWLLGGIAAVIGSLAGAILPLTGLF